MAEDLFDALTDLGKECVADAVGEGAEEALGRIKAASKDAVNAHRTQYFTKFRRLVGEYGHKEMVREKGGYLARATRATRATQAPNSGPDFKKLAAEDKESYQANRKAYENRSKMAKRAIEDYQKGRFAGLSIPRRSADRQGGTTVAAADIKRIPYVRPLGERDATVFQALYTYYCTAADQLRGRVPMSLLESKMGQLYEAMGSAAGSAPEATDPATARKHLAAFLGEFKLSGRAPNKQSKMAFAETARRR